MSSGNGNTPTRRVLAAGHGWSVSAVDVWPASASPALEQQHAQASVAVITSGSVRYRSHRGAATIAAGAWLLGNAGRDFECTWPHSPGDRCITFAYAPEFLADVARAIPGVTRTDFPVHRLPPTPAILPLGARTVAQSLLGDAARWEEIALATAGEALARAGDAAAPRRAPSRRDEARIGDALAVMERRYDAPLTIAGLAAAAEMSRYHFLRVFADVVGTTPYRFLMRTRLGHAALRLATGRDSVSSIAYGAGFGDLSTFIATFRRAFGVAPRDYRLAARRGAAGAWPAAISV
jgi:AraC-like DNA-binding protein